MGRKSKTRGNVCKHIADSLCCQQKLTQHCKATISSVQFSHSGVSDSLWPHGLQLIRLLCPWDSPGKSVGVSCHFLLQKGVRFSSFQFSHSGVSDSLRPHEPQHARPSCPSQTPGVHSNPCPLSWWWHPTISSSVVSFSSCPQPLPASESFPMNQLFVSGGQSIGVSASTSVLPMNTQDWSQIDSMNNSTLINFNI